MDPYDSPLRSQHSLLRTSQYLARISWLRQAVRCVRSRLLLKAVVPRLPHGSEFAIAAMYMPVCVCICI